MRFAPVALLLIGLLPLGARAETYEEMMADPTTWPTEVEVRTVTKGSVLQGDTITGAMLVGPGRKLTVLKLRTDGIVVRTGSVTVLLPVEKTTLVVGAAVAPVEAPAAAVPVPVPVAAKPAAGPAAQVAPTEVQRMLAGRLVQLEDGALKSFDMRKLNGVKFYGIMFSAGWCGPCREFAPHLLESYRSIKNIYPEFELVLVSNDRSSGDMLAYMRDENMPWPAIKYSEIRQIEGITRLGGPGIPCLVLIDGDGHVLADSFDGSTYLGPDSVLEATWRALKKSRHQG
jgi:thiol-disulfide isomerase/thioredoxin